MSKKSIRPGKKRTTSPAPSDYLPLQAIPILGGLVRAFSIDYRTLALFRILISGIILADLCIRGEDFIAFFTDAGVTTRAQLLNYYGEGTWSVYFLNGTSLFAGILFVIAVLAALALLVGYKARLAALVSWVLLVSVQVRNPILLSGADDLMRVLLFWGLFLPLSARFSIDAALEKGNPYPRTNHFSVATIAILMQALYVYWAGALLKTGAEWTRDHTAVYYALNAEHFSTWVGKWVGDTFEFALPLLTQFVLSIEMFGPLFMVAPFLLLWFRLPVMLLLIGMHIGFVVMLNVGHFPYVSITSLLLFIPTAVWAFADRRWVARRSEGIEIYYDKGCEFCKKTVCLLRVFLILPNVKVAPAQDHDVAGPLLEKHDSWVVKRPDGDYLLEWSALTWLVGQSPIFFWKKWPMAWFNKGNVGDRLYHWIGDRRMGFGRFTSTVLPWRESSGKDSMIAQVAVLLLALMVLQINLSYVTRVPHINRDLVTVRNTLGLWQKWNMFAPYPIRSSQWPIIEGIRKDGTRVDLFRDVLKPAPQGKPDDLSYNYSSYRWRKYLGRLYLKKFKNYRRQFASFECKRWNEMYKHDPKNRIAKVQIRTGVQITVLPPRVGRPRITNQGTYSCR